MKSFAKVLPAVTIVGCTYVATGVAMLFATNIFDNNNFKENDSKFSRVTGVACVCNGKEPKISVLQSDAPYKSILFGREVQYGGSPEDVFKSLAQIALNIDEVNNIKVIGGHKFAKRDFLGDGTNYSSTTYYSCTTTDVPKPWSDEDPKPVIYTPKELKNSLDQFTPEYKKILTDYLKELEQHNPCLNLKRSGTGRSK